MVAELEHAAGGELELALALAVLDVLDELHDAEHVGVAGELDGIDRQSDRDAGREQVRGLRQAEADAQLAGRRQATEAPASLIASISSGVSTMPWMICMSLASRPALAMVATWPVAAREPLAWTEIGRPSLRAASISAL